MAEVRIEDIQEMTEKAMHNVVSFRQIFQPAPVEYEPAPFHYEWGEILERGRRHFAIEAFRESGKTSIIRAFLIKCLVYPTRDKDYIIIIMNTQTDASDRLKDIVDEYLTHPIFRLNQVMIKENNQNAFDIVVKSITGEEIEVRIEARGKGGSLRGSLHKEKRPKLIILDDVQDLEDSKSESVTKGDWKWFISDVFFLGRTSRIFMIGNNLGEACLIERVIKASRELHFDTKKIPQMYSTKAHVLNDYGEKVEEREWHPAWPSRDTIEAIESERFRFEQLDEIDVWYREKMCQVMSPDSQVFKMEMFNRKYDPRGLRMSELSVYTTVDLAISQRATADYTVILTVAVNSMNDWFILDCRFGRFNPTQTIDELFDVVSIYNPLIVGIEKVAFQAAMEHFILAQMPQRNIFFRIEPLMASAKKEERIKMLQPRFKTGTIWLPDYVEDWIDELKAEALAFPFARHDDILDALAYMTQIAKKPIRQGKSSNKNKNKKPVYAGSM